MTKFPVPTEGNYVCSVRTCDRPATIALDIDCDGRAEGTARHWEFRCADHRRHGTGRTVVGAHRVTSTYRPGVRSQRRLVPQAQDSDAVAIAQATRRLGF